MTKVELSRSSHMESPRHVLRRATAMEHNRVESITGPLVCRASYARYLRGSLAFREPIEQALAGGQAPAGGKMDWPLCLEGWVPTRIADALRADLRDLSIEPAEALPPFDPSGWNALGVIYVLEGSTLGARLLQRQVLELGFDAAFGARHLARQVEAPWRDFVARLERCSPDEFAGAVGSARATFDFIAASMQSAHMGLASPVRDAPPPGTR